jgi:CHAD domain-containing protein
MGEATVQTTPCCILDDDGKCVARLFVTKVWTGSSDDACEGARGRLLETESVLLDFHLVLQRVRGYRKDFRRIARKFEEAGLTVGPWQETFEHIVTAAGKQPGSYSAKPSYQFKAGMRADEATKKILRSTLAVIRANEEGIKADWDIEFLHDFRTAVRRTRSALNQIPKVFPPDVTERYKEAFAELGARTNQLRDLDVYLLAESEYRAMLPEALRDSISPLFDYMRAQRSQAWHDVVAHLNSTAYAAIVADWATYLSEPAPEQPAAPNAAMPIGKLARRRIAKQYRRVINDGDRILDSDEDELVHQLRIDCKKLRYLLEFFAALFPKKKIDKLIKQLKILQDELGVFNDLSVQQVYLLKTAEVLPSDDPQAKLGLVAVGSLIEKLANEQQAMKPGLAEAFSTFAAPPNRALFRQLLGDKGGRKG